MTRRQCFAALVAGVLGVSAAIRPPQYSMSEFPSPGLANGQIEIGDIITFGTMPHFVGIENKKFRAVRFYEHSITLEMVNS